MVVVVIVIIVIGIITLGLCACCSHATSSDVSVPRQPVKQTSPYFNSSVHLLVLHPNWQVEALCSRPVRLFIGYQTCDHIKTPKTVQTSMKAVCPESYVAYRCHQERHFKDVTNQKVLSLSGPPCSCWDLCPYGLYCNELNVNHF